MSFAHALLKQPVALKLRRTTSPRPKSSFWQRSIRHLSRPKLLEPLGPALHDLTPGSRDPEISHKYKRVALKSLRPRTGRHGTQRNKYCEAAILAAFQHTPRNHIEGLLEAES
jgi:hypothetical protein